MNTPAAPDPRDNHHFSSIVLRVPRETKGRYVAAARAQGLSLAAWMLRHLDSISPPISPSHEPKKPQP